MRNREILPAVLLATVLGGQTACGAGEPDRLAPVVVTAPAPASEVERIQAHLGTVLTELRAADVSHLDPARRANRSHHLRVLAEYRERGRFPRNAVDPDRPTPVFRDEAGTWCAMGHLIARSGYAEVAERIARTRNTAFVWELADDPAVVAWLDENGISPAEAGRVQPMYGPCVNCYPAPRPEEVSTEYAAVSVLSAGLSGGGIAVNLPGLAEAASPAWRGGFGLLAGSLSIGIGAAGVGDGGVGTALGATNIGLGAASAALGIRTLLVGQRAGPEGVRWVLYPVAERDDGGEARSGVGVGLRF